MRPAKSALALAVCFVCSAEAATVVLNKSFVQKIMNAATVTATLEIDAYANAPHSPAIDGELSIAGRSTDIGLTVVAKIENAAMEQDALAYLKTTTPAHPVQVTGAWRIWFHHAGSATERQGAPVDFPTTSNPDHVFGIHPLSRLGPLALPNAFLPVPGFAPPAANIAIASYEKLLASISASATTILISATNSRYNYVEFALELAASPSKSAMGCSPWRRSSIPATTHSLPPDPGASFSSKTAFPRRKSLRLGCETSCM